MSVLQVVTLFNDQTPSIALKSLFSKYDADSNGYLDRDELYKLLEDDLGLTEEQAEAYYHLLDKDADGHVSFGEFQKWFLSGEKFGTINNSSRFYYLRRAIELFKAYDKDNNLAIDQQEFQQLFKDAGGRGRKKEKRAMRELDVDKNCRVSFQEFLNWLNWAPLSDLKF